MFSAKEPRKALSPLEHLAMEVVWRLGSASSEDVRVALAERHPMKESTARTILKRLEEKGYLSRRVEGRTNLYRSAEAPLRRLVIQGRPQLEVLPRARTIA